MFELPEITMFSRQMNAALRGKQILSGTLGNSPHKFVWYNRGPEEFAGLVAGKSVGEATPLGRWLLVALEPGYTLVIGECGGKLRYHPVGEKLPAKYHLTLSFSDDTHLSIMTQMWGAMELYARGEEYQRTYIKGMRPIPTHPEFDFPYFNALIDELAAGEKRSAKGLLTQDQLIPGLGNAIAQDILFNAGLHPRHPIDQLDGAQRQTLFKAILETVEAVIAAGGRYDEIDLFGHAGGYVRKMDKQAAGKPCPVCGTTVQSSQYLGGSCYFCPQCQV